MESIVQYDPKSIAQLLKEFGCNVTLKEIKNPTLESANLIYKMFLEICIAVKPVVYDMEPAPTNYLNDDILKAQSATLKFLQFYKLLIYFFDMCGLSVASFYDMFNPAKKVFNKQISMIINFAKFEFTELNAFQKIQEENKKYEESFYVIKCELEDVQKKNRKIKEELAIKKPAIDKTIAKIQKNKEYLVKLNSEIKHLEEINEKQYKELADIDVTQADLTSKQTKCDKKLKLYETFIVKSPTRLNTEAEKADREICDIKKLIESKNIEIDTFSKQLLLKEKFIDSYSSIKQILEDFYNGQVLIANEKMKKIENFKKEIINFNFQFKESKSNQNVLDNQLEILLSNFKNCEIEFNEEKKRINELEDLMNSKIKNFTSETLLLLKNEDQLKNKIDTIRNSFEEHLKKELAKLDESNILFNKMVDTSKNLLQYYKAKKKSHETFNNEVGKCVESLYEDMSC